MREREVCDGFLVVLLVDRRGNNERVKRFKIRPRCEPCAIVHLDLVPALANVRCRPFGNFPRLPFGRSINNQDVHDILQRRLPSGPGAGAQSPFCCTPASRPVRHTTIDPVRTY